LEHWGIYIQYEEDSCSQMIYHADKTNIINYQTSYEEKSWT